MERRASRSSIRSGRAGPNGTPARRDDHRPHRHRSPPWGPPPSWRSPDRSTSSTCTKGTGRLRPSWRTSSHRSSGTGRTTSATTATRRSGARSRPQRRRSRRRSARRRGDRDRASARGGSGAGQGGQQGRLAQADRGAEEEPAREGRQQDLGRIAVSIQRPGVSGGDRGDQRGHHDVAGRPGLERLVGLGHLQVYRDQFLQRVVARLLPVAPRLPVESQPGVLRPPATAAS